MIGTRSGARRCASCWTRRASASCRRRYRAPNANAYAERFVRSIKEECLNRVIPLGERHLRRTIAEYVEHYHRERNHQGIENALIDGASRRATHGRIRRRPRLRWVAELLRTSGVKRLTNGTFL